MIEKANENALAGEITIQREDKQIIGKRVNNVSKDCTCRKS